MPSKDIAQLLRKARRDGLTVAPDGCGHWRVTAPDGRHAIIPGSPRGGKGLHRSRSLLRHLTTD